MPFTLLQVIKRQLGDLVSTLDARVPDEGGGIETKTAALLRMLRGIVEAVSKNEPERLDPLLRNMATAVGRLRTAASNGSKWTMERARPMVSPM